MCALSISIFNSDKQPWAAGIKEGDWASFTKQLRAPLDSSIAKEALPMWSPTTFRGDYRSGENVIAVHALCFDGDAAPIPHRGQIEEAFAGFRSITHSSSSATAVAPRWRHVVAISRPMTPEEHTRVWHVVTSCLPFAVGPQAKDPSRAWYMPRRGVDGYFEAFETDGEPINVDEVLQLALPAVQSHARAPRGLTKVPGAPPCAIDGAHPQYQARLQWFVSHCETCAPPTRGGETFAIASRGTRSAELPPDVVLSVLWHVLRPRCPEPVPEADWHKVERLVQRTISVGQFESGTVKSELEWARFLKELDQKRNAAPAPLLWTPPDLKGREPVVWKAPRRRRIGNSS